MREYSIHFSSLISVFKKVKFTNCKVDTLTYAFLKNNQANLEGITLLNDE
jgi:hypothetical protein